MQQQFWSFSGIILHKFSGGGHTLTSGHESLATPLSEKSPAVLMAALLNAPKLCLCRSSLVWESPCPSSVVGSFSEKTWKICTGTVKEMLAHTEHCLRCTRRALLLDLPSVNGRSMNAQLYQRLSHWKQQDPTFLKVEARPTPKIPPSLSHRAWDAGTEWNWWLLLWRRVWWWMGLPWSLSCDVIFGKDQTTERLGVQFLGLWWPETCGREGSENALRKGPEMPQQMEVSRCWLTSFNLATRSSLLLLCCCCCCCALRLFQAQSQMNLASQGPESAELTIGATSPFFFESLVGFPGPWRCMDFECQKCRTPQEPVENPRKSAKLGADSHKFHLLNRSCVEDIPWSWRCSLGFLWYSVPNWKRDMASLCKGRSDSLFAQSRRVGNFLSPMLLLPSHPLPCYVLGMEIVIGETALEILDKQDLCEKLRLHTCLFICKVVLSLHHFCLWAWLQWCVGRIISSTYGAKSVCAAVWNAHENLQSFIVACSSAWSSRKIYLILRIFNILQTTATPNNNGSYGIKVGVRMA